MVARLPQSQSRRFIVPEVIQSSSMDCGPAALKALLAGYGIDASYGRLREACQTDLDGTSIDTLEELAVDLGLEAEQVMVPLDHLLIPESRTLPAIIVTRHPNGSTHFVVLWRRHGAFLQVMDPSSGRRWVRAKEFLADTFVYTFEVPAESWRQWAGSDEFLGALLQRLDSLGVSNDDAARLSDDALGDSSWRHLARLDAAVRMAESLVDSGGVKKGREALAAIEAVDVDAIPDAYWSVSSAGDDDLSFRGALLIRALGPRAEPDTGSGSSTGGDLAQRIREGEPRPVQQLFELLRRDGGLVPSVLAGALIVSAGGLLLEALLLRSLLDVGSTLDLSVQRGGAVVAVAYQVVCHAYSVMTAFPPAFSMVASKTAV